MKLLRPRVALIGAGAALVLAAGVAIPVAALTGSSPVTYYACVTAKTGAPKIVSKSATCAPGQHKISWNSVGPQGPQGPQGPAGVVTSYIDQADPQVPLNNSTDTVAATLALPAGSFQVSADIALDLTNTTPDTASCFMQDGSNNVLDEQYTTYGLTGELTLLGDTTAGGSIQVECFDLGNNAEVNTVNILAIPVSSVAPADGARSGHVRHWHLPMSPGHLPPAHRRRTGQAA